MYKRVLLSLTAVSFFLLNACSEKEHHDDVETPIAFTAFAMDGDAYSAIVSDSEFMWAPGDEICVFCGSSKGARFTTHIIEPAVQAEFAGNLYGSVDEGYDTNQFWAVYPYISGISCDGAGVVACLPHEQSAVAGAGNRL